MTTPLATLSATLTRHGVDHFTETGAVLIPNGPATIQVTPTGSPAHPWRVTRHNGPPSPYGPKTTTVMGTDLLLLDLAADPPAPSSFDAAATAALHVAAAWDPHTPSPDAHAALVALCQSTPRPRRRVLDNPYLTGAVGAAAIVGTMYATILGAAMLK